MQKCMKNAKAYTGMDVKPYHILVITEVNLKSRRKKGDKSTLDKKQCTYDLKN